MGETLREGATSVVQTINQTFVFRGRSRRLDIGYYWIASMAAVGALEAVVRVWLDWDSEMIARMAIGFVAVVPFFALFARRLHDQGRSAWWTLILPVLGAANVYKSIRVNFHAFDPAWPELGIWNPGLLILALLSLAFMIQPGDVGANRYGPDPRLTEPEPEPGTV